MSDSDDNLSTMAVIGSKEAKKRFERELERIVGYPKSRKLRGVRPQGAPIGCCFFFYENSWCKFGAKCWYPHISNETTRLGSKWRSIHL